MISMAGLSKPPMGWKLLTCWLTPLSWWHFFFGGGGLGIPRNIYYKHLVYNYTLPETNIAQVIRVFGGQAFQDELWIRPYDMFVVTFHRITFLPPLRQGANSQEVMTFPQIRPTRMPNKQ